MSNFNGCLGGSRVFEFRNESSSWITWSVGFDSPTPAAGTAAAAWSTLSPCYDLAPSVMLDKPTAIAVARLLRSLRRREGLVILSDREFGHASGYPRPVTIDGVTYDSERVAAATLGISRRQAARYADSAGFNE